MTGAADWLWYVIGFLLVIGPLIFIHELGHYFVARWFGVKAEVFSIGFGREIGGWTDRRGTRWKLCWLPIGGYVRFAGDMSPASEPTKEWLSLPPEERARNSDPEPRFAPVESRPCRCRTPRHRSRRDFLFARRRRRTPASGKSSAPVTVRPADRWCR